MVTSFADKIKTELSDYEVGADVRSHIDEWLKADKEFNTWFLVTTKRALADDELMALLDGYRESQEIVEGAWGCVQYSSGSDPASMLIEGITQVHPSDEAAPRGPLGHDDLKARPREAAAAVTEDDPHRVRAWCVFGAVSTFSENVVGSVPSRPVRSSRKVGPFSALYQLTRMTSRCSPRTRRSRSNAK